MTISFRSQLIGFVMNRVTIAKIRAPKNNDVFFQFCTQMQACSAIWTYSNQENSKASSKSLGGHFWPLGSVSATPAIS